jgi:hypothetical protein
MRVTGPESWVCRGEPAGEARTLTGEDGRSLLGDLLAGGTTVRIRVTGMSMAPFLTGGEFLTIAPAPRDPAPGDILLYRGDGGAIIIHRLLGKAPGTDGERLLLKGDGLAGPDDPVLPGEILGRVTAVERENPVGPPERTDLLTPPRRLAARWIARRAFLAHVGRRALRRLLGRDG